MRLSRVWCSPAEDKKPRSPEATRERTHPQEERPARAMEVGGEGQPQTPAMQRALQPSERAAWKVMK